MKLQEKEIYYKEIQEAKERFYENNKKNMVFKNTQKLECAQHVANNMDLMKMIQCTVFIVPNTNIIYYNYMVFKTYGSEATHIPLYNHITNLVSSLLEKYPTFEFHINLKTFTISACQRYYHLIASSFDENHVFTNRMSKMVIYHTPSIVDQITKILYNSVKDILPKAVYYHQESEQEIKKLFNL